MRVEGLGFRLRYIPPYTSSPSRIGIMIGGTIIPIKDCYFKGNIPRFRAWTDQGASGGLRPWVYSTTS